MTEELDDLVHQLPTEAPPAELRQRMLGAGLSVFSLEHERTPVERRYFAVYRSVVQPVGVGIVVLVYLVWGVSSAFG